MNYSTWQIPFIFVGLLAVIPIVLRRPATALYVLIGAAAVIDVFPLAFPDSLSDTIPFFLNLNNSAQLPIGISPAEIVMATAILAWCISASQRAVQRPSRRIFRAYGVYMLAVLLAEGWG